MPKFDKFYTTTGDDGTTSLLGEGRVKKHHPRPEAYGAVDEAQTALGMARAQMLDREAAAVIVRTQRDLYHAMAELAATKAAAPKFRTIGADHVKYLEDQTDHYGALIELPREFILSGDSLPGAALDMARTVTRRAERRVVKLMDESMIENVWLVRYLNRLSSLLFVLARYEDALSGNSNVTLAKDNSAAQNE
jgi:cob(I)alamin adenosyltransferase